MVSKKIMIPTYFMLNLGQKSLIYYGRMPSACYLTCDYFSILNLGEDACLRHAISPAITQKRESKLSLFIRNLGESGGALDPRLPLGTFRGFPNKKSHLEQLYGESGGARTLDTGLKRPVL